MNVATLNSNSRRNHEQPHRWRSFQRLGLKYALTGGIFGLLALKTAAGPHHFERWQSGVVAEVNASERTFALKDSQTSKQVEFAWDEHTRVWTGHTDPVGGKPFDSAAIKVSESVRVMSRQVSGHLVAKRIVLTADGKH